MASWIRSSRLQRRTSGWSIISVPEVIPCSTTLR